ncbi:MAG: sugar transferase [Clostridiales bacterium]|nr:sugar transferase [Clostridiales bacterium]
MVTYSELPENMKNETTAEYLEILKKRKFHLVMKRCFDISVSLILLICFSPFFLLLAVAIKLDSKGPVFYRQIRVGRYNQDFKIFKFRSMVSNADKIGLAITTGNDPRITRMGKFIRKCRLDEISQLLNVLNGTMSLVGPRPEVRKYVDAYQPKYMATLLVRPGVTAEASIRFRNEDELLAQGDNPEKIYMEDILPIKMNLGLEYMKKVSVFRDMKIMFQTVFAVLKK